MSSKDDELRTIKAKLAERGETFRDLLEKVLTMDDLGITHEQLETIGRAVDGFAEAFETAITAVPRERRLAALQEQARTIAERMLGHPLAEDQAAVIDLVAEGRLDQWTARTRALTRAYLGPGRRDP